MAGRARHRETFKERQERRGAVDDPQVVLNAAARYLETRSRSVAEVRRHLAGGGYRTELVEAAIERLLELRMLDDEAFARGWVESRDRARPRGTVALRRELALKGIDRETATAILEERDDAAEEAAESGSADEDAARRLLARRAKSLERIADLRARRQRAYALLARNGFDPEVCRSASSAFADTNMEDDADDRAAGDPSD